MGRKLTGKPRETIKVELAEGVTATVAYLTRKDQNDIAQHLYRKRWDAEANDGKGGVVLDQDFESHTRERLRRLVPTVGGLTWGALEALAEVPEGVDLDVPESEEGAPLWSHDDVVFRETIQIDAPTEKEPNRKRPKTIAYTLPAYLYSYAPREAFAAKIDGVQDEFHRLKSEAEKKSSTTSGDLQG